MSTLLHIRFFMIFEHFTLKSHPDSSLLIRSILHGYLIFTCYLLTGVLASSCNPILVCILILFCWMGFQSRVGPVQWLKPYTDEVLVELGQKGVKSLLAVPVR